MEEIYAYTREQAIEDGAIVPMENIVSEDLLNDSKRLIKFPIHFTESVSNQIHDKPKHEDINGRCWDIVNMLLFAIKESQGDTSLIKFKMILNDNANFSNKNVEFKAIVHGGDNGEPIITIMQLNED